MTIRSDAKARHISQSRTTTPATSNPDNNNILCLAGGGYLVATGAGRGLLNSRLQYVQKYHVTRVLGVVGGRGLTLVLSQKGHVISAILIPLDGVEVTTLARSARACDSAKPLVRQLLRHQSARTADAPESEQLNQCTDSAGIQLLRHDRCEARRRRKRPLAGVAEIESSTTVRNHWRQRSGLDAVAAVGTAGLSFSHSGSLLDAVALDKVRMILRRKASSVGFNEARTTQFLWTRLRQGLANRHRRDELTLEFNH